LEQPLVEIALTMVKMAARSTHGRGLLDIMQADHCTSVFSIADGFAITVIT